MVLIFQLCCWLMTLLHFVSFLFWPCWNFCPALKQIGLYSFILWGFFFGWGYSSSQPLADTEILRAVFKIQTPGLHHNRVEFRETVRSPGIKVLKQPIKSWCVPRLRTTVLGAGDFKHLLITKLLFFKHYLDVAHFKKSHDRVENTGHRSWGGDS